MRHMHARRRRNPPPLKPSPPATPARCLGADSGPTASSGSSATAFDPSPDLRLVGGWCERRGLNRRDRPAKIQRHHGSVTLLTGGSRRLRERKCPTEAQRGFGELNRPAN